MIGAAHAINLHETGVSGVPGYVACGNLVATPTAMPATGFGTRTIALGGAAGAVILGGLGAAHDFKQLHHISRTKKMQANDVLRALETLPGLREPDPPDFQDMPETVDRDLIERLAQLLSPTPVSRDEMVRAAQAPAPAVFAALMELALAGRAELRPGGMVVKG